MNLPFVLGQKSIRFNPKFRGFFGLKFSDFVDLRNLYELTHSSWHDGSFRK